MSNWFSQKSKLVTGTNLETISILYLKYDTLEKIFENDKHLNRMKNQRLQKMKLCIIISCASNLRTETSVKKLKVSV